MKDIPKLQPQLSDEERDRADLALQKVDEIADKLAGQSLRLDQDYRALFGAMPGESRDKVIWRGIVSFANSVDLDAAIANLDAAADTHASDFKTAITVTSKFIGKEINKFFWLLVFCTQADISGNTGREDFLESFSDVRATAGRIRDAGQNYSKALLLSFPLLCTQYQPQLKRFMTWLCAPQKNKDLSSKALTFLGNHARGVDVRPDFSDANFDENAIGYCPFYYWKTVQYQSLMSPICKFIFDRIERYHDWLDRIPRHPNEKLKDDEESERENAVPIRMCERPGCGKFLVPQRVGRKRFCSKTCLASQPGRTIDENRDYMWLYRLEQEPLAVLRAKLKLPARRQRLARIESDWPDLADKVMKLKQRAGK